MDSEKSANLIGPSDFCAWYQSSFGTRSVSVETRGLVELLRWSWMELTASGEEHTWESILRKIILTSPQHRSRGMQILNEAYEAYAEDHRRYASSLAPGVRLGSFPAFRAR